MGGGRKKRTKNALGKETQSKTSQVQNKKKNEPEKLPDNKLHKLESQDNKLVNIGQQDHCGDNVSVSDNKLENKSDSTLTVVNTVTITVDTKGRKAFSSSSGKSLSPPSNESNQSHKNKSKKGKQNVDDFSNDNLHFSNNQISTDKYKDSKNDENLQSDQNIGHERLCGDVSNLSVSDNEPSNNSSLLDFTVNAQTIDDNEDTKPAEKKKGREMISSNTGKLASAPYNKSDQTYKNNGKTGKHKTNRDNFIKDERKDRENDKKSSQFGHYEQKDDNLEGEDLWWQNKPTPTEKRLSKGKVQEQSDKSPSNVAVKFKERFDSRPAQQSRSFGLKPDAEFDSFEQKYIAKNESMDFQKVIEVDGDLFLAGDEYSLGHCVAEDMNMGSGIAVTFRQNFKRVDELLDQRQTQGGLAFLHVDNRYIYYLVTKKISSGKPTYLKLWCSLQKMKKHMVENNVEKLALPRIGCGLDGLEWVCVKKMLEYIFENVNVEIKIFNFQQDLSDDAPRKLRKCPVVNAPYPVSNIDVGTIIIYFGSEDGYETEAIKSLNEKFPYIANIYRREGKTVGKTIRTDKNDYMFYGCIVRKRYTDHFDFKRLQECLSFIQRQNRKDLYNFVAFQAFEDKDDLIVTKIINLMRYSLSQVEVYVCWPENLRHLMPQNKM